MSIINNVLGIFLGNKYERDLKEINPYIEKIHQESEKVKSLSNDELRNETDALRKEILGSIEVYENEIKSLRDKAEIEEDVYQKEEIYNEIDKIEKQINEKLEETLDSVVPKAFAIVKETATRFKENSVLEATARQYDRDLAATRESVLLTGLSNT